MVPMSVTAAPGHFNDLDVIGFNTGMSPNEVATQIVFWAAAKSVWLDNTVHWTFASSYLLNYHDWGLKGHL